MMDYFLSFNNIKDKSLLSITRGSVRSKAWRGSELLVDFYRKDQIDEMVKHLWSHGSDL